MGSLLSKFNNSAIDGLGYPAPGGPRPTPQSFEKLQQLLRGLVTYEPNSLAPVLVSLYYLGFTPSQLTTAYDELAEPLVQWPEENPIADSIGDESLTDFFGLYEYQERYFEFFRDQLTEFTDWHEILNIYLPIIGLRLLYSQFAPVKELAVAVEVNDPVLAMHALAAACASNEPFKDTGRLDMSPQELVALCGDSTHLVTAQMLCELTLANASFSPLLGDVVSAFANYAQKNPCRTQIYNYNQGLDKVKSDLNLAPLIRAQTFAKEFQKNTN